MTQPVHTRTPAGIRLSGQTAVVMERVNNHTRRARLLCTLCFLTLGAATLSAQQPLPTFTVQLPNAPSISVISGTVSDSDQATISNAYITLEDTEAKTTSTTQSDDTGAFSFPAVPPGKYLVRI